MNPEENVNPEAIESGEVSTPPEEQTEQTSQETAEETQRPSESQQARNWRAMEDRQDELLRQNAEYQRQNQELLESVKQYVAPKKKEEPEFAYDKTDIPTFEDTEKVVSKHARTYAEKAVADALAKERARSMPKLVKETMPDYEEVVTDKNVDYLMKNEPEIATAFSYMQDPYEQRKATYNYLKKSGIYKGSDTKAMKRDAEVNSKKPVNPAAVGRQNSVDENMFSNGLTKDLQKTLYQEMLDSMKGA